MSTKLLAKTDPGSKIGYFGAEHRIISFRMPDKQPNFEVVFETDAGIAGILADRGTGSAMPDRRQ